MADKTQVIALSDLAKELGLHRTTIIRMEQRGVVDKAQWSGPPVNGRVYDKTLADKVRKQIAKHFQEQAAKMEGRQLLTNVELVGKH